MPEKLARLLEEKISEQKSWTFELLPPSPRLPVLSRPQIPLELVLVDNSSSSAWSAVHRAREMLERELLAGKNPSLRRAVPSERTDEDVEASNVVKKLFFVVEELPQTDPMTSAAAAAPAGGQGGRKMGKDGASEKYTIPYWAILRVVEEQPLGLKDDKDQGEHGWLFADNAALHPVSQGVSRLGTALTSAKRLTPPPPAPALLSHHASPVSSQSSMSFGGGRGPTGGVLPSSHGPSDPVGDVCPPTVSINMKICVHHPAGSALASKREAVVEQLRLVSDDLENVPTVAAMPRRAQCWPRHSTILYRVPPLQTS